MWVHACMDVWMCVGACRSRYVSGAGGRQAPGVWVHTCVDVWWGGQAAAQACVDVIMHDQAAGHDQAINPTMHT